MDRGHFGVTLLTLSTVVAILTVFSTLSACIQSTWGGLALLLRQNKKCEVKAAA